MANRIVLRLLPFLALLLVSCGNSGSPAPTGGGTNGGQKVIDPSGNWTMTATDGGGKSVQFAALYNQVGADVTANSFTAAGNPAPFACVPFTAVLSNGLVQNVSNFTGTVTFGNNFGAFTFSATLAQDGKSFTGTYSNMPSCTGLLLSGTFIGAEVPTTTGSWTGTLTPCTVDQQAGTCTAIQGAAAGTFAASLTQNDSTGNVTGTYQVTGLPGLTTGTVSVNPPSDILSGLVWQFSMSDNSGTKGVANGNLNENGRFDGNAISGSAAFILSMSH
jgi:hypothetical protein